MPLTKVSYSMISGAPISVLDYANLAAITSCRDPGDVNSHLLTSFLNWTPAIQAALDEAHSRGGGCVVLPKNTVPYYVQDPITIKSNTTVVFQDFIILADYNLSGHTIGVDGENVHVHNVQIDNSNIFAGGSGYNGITAAGKNIRFYGGVVKNCARGFDPAPLSPNDGGKGVQIEVGGAEAVVIDGVTFDNCFIAMSTVRGYEEADPFLGIVYNNITANDCEILFLVKQTNGAQNQTGLQHTVQLSNFYAVNCGAFEGVFQFSRASNVMVSNGIVVNDPAVVTTSLIRGNHANSTFSNVSWYGDTNSCISLDPSTYAPDDSQPNENNVYDINVWGQVQNFADANILTNFRTLNSCTGNVSFRLPPSVAFFGFELRNGTSAFNMSCNIGPFGNSKIVQAQTNVNFYGSIQPSNFEGFEVGAYNQIAYAAVSPTTGTHFIGKIIFNNSPTPSGTIGFVCTTSGTFGTYAEGLTVTSTGTTSVTLSGANTELQVGMYLNINGIAAGKILSITGTTMVMSVVVAAGSGLSVAYTTPVYKTFGTISP